MLENEEETISWLQGGLMGIVSGMKGGAPAGALIGSIVMGINTADVEIRSLWFYAIVVGLTLGLMGGAAFGAGYGFTSGIISTRPFMGAIPIKLTWYVFALALCLYAPWQMLPENLFIALLVGISSGIAAGYFGSREFISVLQMQHEPEEEEEEEQAGETAV